MNTKIAFIGQVSDTEQNTWLAKINSLLTDAELIPFEQLTPAQKRIIEVAVVADPDPKDIAQLPQLRWVQSLWAGVERLLLELPNADFDIVRMIDPNLSTTMAEAAVAWTYYLHRDMPKYLQQQKQKIWQPHNLVALEDRHIGVLGLGELGRASVSKLLLNGFKVSGWSKNLADIEGIECFSGMDGLEAMLTNTNILICLLPLTSETQHLLNAERLSMLTKGAAIINFARGPIIDTEALLQQLESRHINHAVLDVFDIEPLPATSALWASPNITILPHISAPTNFQTASEIVAHNLMHYFATGTMPAAINRSRGY